MSVRITERFEAAPFAGARVDEAAGLIRDAVLCGFESKNRRQYRWKESKLAGRVGLYEGCKVHLNHSRSGRDFQEWIGVIQGARAGRDGRPRGAVKLFKSDPYAAKVMEAAQVCPDKFGLSHVVLADTRREGGVDVVQDITAVESVDIVCDPATVAGLFEGIQQGGRAVANRATATRVIEDVMAGTSGALRSGLRRVLVEQLDLKNHRDAVTTAFVQAGHLTWSAFIEGQITEDDLLAKLKKLAKGHRDAGGSGDDSGAPALESVTPADFARSVAGRAPAGLGTLLREGHADAKAFARSLRN